MTDKSFEKWMEFFNGGFSQYFFLSPETTFRHSYDMTYNEYRYPVKRLQRIREPYDKLTKWEISCARVHAQESGPGSLAETLPTHRVCLPSKKFDRFLHFVNCPYFCQDVTFGTRKLGLNSARRSQYIMLLGK